MSIIRDASALGGLPAYALVIVLMPEYAIRLVIAFVIMMAIAVPLRMLTKRERPNKRKGYGLLNRIEASSFPSVHAARVSIIAAMITTSAWMLIPAAAIITMVSISRIVLREHDWIDVAAGIVLGIGSWALATLI